MVEEEEEEEETAAMAVGEAVEAKEVLGCWLVSRERKRVRAIIADAVSTAAYGNVHRRRTAVWVVDRRV